MNRYFWLFVFLLGSYWPIAWENQQDNFMLAVLNAVGVSAALGVLVSFTPVLLQMFRIEYGKVERGHALIFGLWCFALAGTIRFSWLWVYRILDPSPDWMLHADFFGWGTWIFCVGGIALLIADKGGPHDMPPKDWLKVGYSIFLGVFAALVSITLVKGWWRYG